MVCRSAVDGTMEVFLKKCVLNNFANVTGKLLCWSLFTFKLQTFARPAN